MGWVVYGVRWVLWAIGGLLRRWQSGPAWVHLVVDGPVPAFDPPRGPFWRRFLGSRPGPSLRELQSRVRRLARDPRVRGVVFHLRPAPLPAADAAALAGLFPELRGAGKRSVCWATSYTAGTYRVACAADEVLVQPGGVISPLGLSRSYLFLKDALDRLGVEAEAIQVSPYKTAADMLTRQTLTPQAREMADWLADSELEERVAAVSAGRRLDAARARDVVDGSPYTDSQALEVGAIDGICTEEALPERLGSDPVPFDMARRKLWRPAPRRPGPVVGLLRIEGPIVDGPSQRPPISPPVPLGPLLQQSAGDLTLVQQARRLAAAGRVAAVLLWIDSPGGSATASEAIAAALEALAKKKPLIAVMGAVAGSGGYYVATPARRIFAQPGTLTGSIGVITAKVAMGGLLRRLLVGHEVVARGAHAGLEDATQPWSEGDRAKVRAMIDRLYGIFLERVAKSRGRTVAAVEPLAGGRVWTGRQALVNGLVDEIGGVEQALAEARRLAGLRDDARLIELPGHGHLAPVAATPAAVVATLHALTQAPALMLTPLLDPTQLGLPPL